MNREQLSDAIGRLDDSIIESAMQSTRSRRPWWYAAVAVAACVCVLVGCLLAINGGGDKPPVEPPVGDVSSTTSATTTTTAEDTTTTTESTTTATTTTTTTTTTTKPTTTTTTTTMTTKPTTTTAPIPKVEVLAMEIPPMMAQYATQGKGRTAWIEGVEKQREKLGDHNEGMTAYYADVIPTVLGTDRGKNRVFSPLSLYLCLGMLAETTAGESRQQVLDLMGVTDTAALQAKCSGLWNGVFIDDTVSTCRLSNSLWLANKLLFDGRTYAEYNAATVDRLAQQYYATVYRGEMGSPEYNATLQKWVNDHTGGMLKGPASNLELTDDTTLALVNALYFKMKWRYSFYETVDGVFHTAEGDVTRSYMKQDEIKLTAGYGDSFTAVRMPMDGGRSWTDCYYSMVILLPDEGVSADALLHDPQALGFIEGDETLATFLYTHKVNLKLPKFDVLSDMELTEQLKLLGVTDVFDKIKANFSGILTKQILPVAVSEVKHAARVKIDEEGCEAAAYTMIYPTGAGMPKDEPLMDFTVDRPFMFAITGPGNTILFAGIVENP